MSRVGKRPIEIPSGVTVDFAAPLMTVKGGRGTLARTLPPKVNVEIDSRLITVRPVDESREARAMWGLTRTLVSNMVMGVSNGFTKELEIVGVGYRADLQGDTIALSLGFSHPVEFKLPNGISATVDRQTKIVLQGADKELLGLTAARIRALRKPEPYKGKGIRYANEVVRRKVGKAGAK